MTGSHAPQPPPDGLAQTLLDRYGRARNRRDPWLALWRDCYDHALPQRGHGADPGSPGARRGDALYDGTAPDAVEQLAASLLAQLTPPWSRWFGFAPGPEATPAERKALAPVLEEMEAALETHLDRSNFAVEIHQCYLDLVVGGTATLLVEPAAPGALSALRFAAVPLGRTVLEEGADGRLDIAFREAALTLEALRRRYSAVPLPPDLVRDGLERPETTFPVLDAVLPEPADRGGGYRHVALLVAAGAEGGPRVLEDRRLAQTPYVSFRWLKAPGEAYGRSPVMKALPDIRTANKVVELVLKNATIAVTGIWQADDDGVLNPATVRLTPGTIIPKAVGSSGLTPLKAPGQFDVSQLVLEDLRGRIRHALLVDQLAQIDGPRMTATEVIERAGQMARLLGATYGRLQAELLTPLVLRAQAILRARGEVADLAIDGRLVQLQYRSPLAQAQGQRDAQAILGWIEAAAALGPEALAAVDLPAAARWLGGRFGVPEELIRPPPEAAPPLAGSPVGGSLAADPVIPDPVIPDLLIDPALATAGLPGIVADG